MNKFGMAMNNFKNNVYDRIIEDYITYFCVYPTHFVSHKLYFYLTYIVITCCGICGFMPILVNFHTYTPNIKILVSFMGIILCIMAYSNINFIKQAYYIMKQKKRRLNIIEQMRNYDNKNQFLNLIESDDKAKVCGNLPKECMYCGCMLYVGSDILLKLSNDEIAQLFQICSQKDREFFNYIYNKRGFITYRQLDVLEDSMSVSLTIYHNPNALTPLNNLDNKKKTVLTLIK